jgi:Tfp pilus assembly protein PilN
MSPNQNQNSSESQQLTYFSIGVVLVVIISSVIIYGIGYTQSRQASSYENKIEAVEQELKQFEEVEKQALALGVAEDNISDLYQRQNTYASLISDLADLALKDVKLATVNLDSSDSSLQIQGQAKNYLDVNKQVVAYQRSESIDDIQILSATEDEKGRIQFSLLANINK